MTEIVELYMYDIGNNAGIIVGENEIWHTSIVVYGYELSFNSTEGVQIAENPGNPTTIEELGKTTISWKQLEMYVNLLASKSFRKCDYNVMNNNCNNFSDTVATFLCGRPIPDDILDLPTRVAGKGAIVACAAAVSSSSSSSSCNIM